MGNDSASSAIDPLIAIKLANLSHGIVHTQLLYAAIKLNIPDLLADAPRTASELAVSTGTAEPRLYRVLRALSALGLVTEIEPRLFELRPLGAALRARESASQRDFALMMGSPWHAGAWAQILSSVDVPTSAFEKVFSEDVFSYLEKFPDERDVFDRAMAFTSSAHAEAIALAIRVDTKATLVDVAGGTGLLLRELLERNPELEGVLFERPEVVEKATSYLSSAGMGERCRVVSGDFFKSVPSGGDIYMLKYIIHDWSDEDAGIILRNCRTAMKDDGKLILLEVVQPDRNPSFSEVWSDIEMMVVLPGGRERTRAEFGDLLATSGFELVDVRRTRSELSVIEALPR